MRWPRIRFTPRRSMLAVAVVACGSWIFLRWDPDTGVSHGVGHVRIPLVFLVSDGDTGRPIEGARVLLRDRDRDSNPVHPYVLDLRTGPDGRATVLDDWPFYVSEGVPSGRLHFYRVVYPHWEMTFTAEGYVPAEGSFREHEAGDRRFHEAAPPPPIVVRLRRVPD